ncbi:MAG: glycosyltransferase family 4 protein [Chloroflexi bacterium]|nr:glycosyltransferase family 4 protein [Chloroflexota bacterium]
MKSSEASRHIGINAHLLSFSSSYRGAGISRYIRGIATGVRGIAGPERYTIFLGDPNYPPELAPDGKLGVEVSRWPTVRPMVRILWEQLILPVELARRRVDVLHSMGYAQPLACASRSIVTVHDLTFMLFPNTFNRTNRAYLSLFTRLSVRRADRVIAVSHNTKDDIVRLIGIAPEKVAVIHHGVEPMFRKIEDRSQIEAFKRRRGLPDRYVLFIGTLEPRKNLLTLLSAFARLKKESNIPHRLVIGGAKGWMWDEILATIERLDLRRDVLLPGYLPLDEEPMWYNGADLFVYPSLYEGFGFPPLESMACGTPVITSDGSALPEVVGDAGVLVDPTDTDQLAGAMRTVLGDTSLREDLARRGLERASSFSWEEAARRTVEAYRECFAS